MLMFHVAFIILIGGVLSARNFTFKKCCDNASIYNTTSLKCEPANITMLDDMFWFPFTSALNGTTSEQLTQVQIEEMKRNFTAKYGVKYGFPKCLSTHNHTEGYYVMNGTSNDFNIVLDDHDHRSGVFVSQDMYGFQQHDGFWLIPFSDACFDMIQDPEEYIVKYCPTEETPWFPKCCGARELINVTAGGCISIAEYDNVNDWRPEKTQDIDRHYITQSIPNCPNDFGMLHDVGQHHCRGFSTKVKFLRSGDIEHDGFIYTADEYCGEKTLHDGNILMDNILLCLVEESSAEQMKKKLYGVLFIIGGVCLLITVGLSLWLPELRRHLHNQIALTHNATLMVAYFAWGSTKLSSNLEASSCIFPCMVVQFTFLGSLFWLNAMCIDMSSTFRTARLAARGSWRRYIYYSAYAWGLNAVISIFTLCMELAEEGPLGMPRPGFTCYCDYAQKTIAPVLYFYGPMALLLTFNLVLYIFTAWKIMSVHRQTDILRRTDSNATGSSSQNSKQRLIVYTKLFLLMGLTYVTEIIGWCVDGGESHFWIVLDVINLLRAVLIFVLFICKRPVLRSIRQRVNFNHGFLRRSTTSANTEALSISTNVSRKVSEVKGDIELKEYRERKMSEMKTLVNIPVHKNDFKKTDDLEDSN